MFHYFGLDLMKEVVYFNFGDVFALLIRALTSWPDLC